MSLSTLLPPLTSDLPPPSLCTATVNGISEACSLIYLFLYGCWHRPVQPEERGSVEMSVIASTL